MAEMSFLSKQLECPVCFEQCTRPIFMCKNGHNVCAACSASLHACAVCREPGRPDIRNRFAEEVSAEVGGEPTSTEVARADVTYIPETPRASTSVPSAPHLPPPLSARPVSKSQQYSTTASPSLYSFNRGYEPSAPHLPPSVSEPSVSSSQQYRSTGLNKSPRFQYRNNESSAPVNWMAGPGVQQRGSGQHFVGNNLTVHGNNNRVTGNGNTVNGNDCWLNGNNAYVNGNGNTVNGNNHVIYGDTNKVVGNNHRITGHFNRATGNNICTYGKGNRVVGNNNKCRESAQ